MTCPHCRAPVAEVDRGATGLDLCTRCGGLSRRGKRLEREQPFRNFARPELVDLDYVHARGVIVAAVRLEDGSTGVAVTYALDDGTRLPAIVVSGQQAVSLARLVADALAAGQRTAN